MPRPIDPTTGVAGPVEVVVGSAESRLRDLERIAEARDARARRAGKVGVVVAQGAIVEMHFDEDGLYPIVTHAFNFVGRGALGLFQAGDGGWNTVIRDGDGANVAELEGFAGAPVKGVVAGQKLVVVANFAPLFTFEDFVGNEQAFAGVQIGDQFIPTEDLLA